MQQLVKQLAAIGMLMAVAALPAGAYVITPGVGGAFDLTVSGSAFTSWALANGGVKDGAFDTFVSNTKYVSGSTSPSTATALTIPFTSAVPFTSATLNVGSVVLPYGSNWGRTVIYANVGGVDTRIFQMDSPDYAINENYNYNGTTPSGDEFSGSVDISSLVAGATAFSIRFYSSTGWSGSLYNGGVFYTGFNLPAGQDFRLTGEAIPEPVTGLLVLLGLGGLLGRRCRSA